jgi:hypothetical protein
MAVESPKVPLEIFFNPTILSDDSLLSEFSDFFTPKGGERGINAEGQNELGSALFHWFDERSHTSSKRN